MFNRGIKVGDAVNIEFPVFEANFLLIESDSINYS